MHVREREAEKEMKKEKEAFDGETHAITLWPLDMRA